MFIDSEKRLKQLSDEAKKNTEDLEEAKKNSRFTQVSPKGWERVRELLLRATQRPLGVSGRSPDPVT
ncbi:hypothetical protein ACTJ7X_28830 (plasmid) [Escherichia coli]|uniref:hypothetical protein n=1 Tax=Escherichia coli TaxID=562 RepID=UPI003F934ECD